MESSVKRLLLLAMVLVTLLGAAPQADAARPRASDCAFEEPPMTYEADQKRRLYLDAMELAAFDMLAPGDNQSALVFIARRIYLEASPRRLSRNKIG